MQQQAPNSEPSFQRTIFRQRNVVSPVVLHVNGVLCELWTNDVHNLCIQRELALGDQILDNVIHRKHFRVGGNVIEGVICDLGTTLFSRQVLIIGVDRPPGILVDEPAISDYGDLRTAKTMANIRLHQAVNELRGLRADLRVAEASVYEFREVRPDDNCILQ